MSDILLGKVPPHDPEAEAAVIGCMMQEQGVIPAVVEQVGAEDFYVQANSLTFAAMLDMQEAGEAIDHLTLQAFMRQKGTYDDVGPDNYWNYAQAVPCQANAVYYARIVRNMSLKREAIQRATGVLRAAYEPSSDGFSLLSEAIDGMQTVLTRIEPGSTCGAEKGVEAACDLIDREQKLRDRKVWTGLDDIDGTTRGFLPGQLVIVGSRPSHGKSTMLLNICRNNAKHGVPGLLFSLEMARGELWRNLLLAEGETSIEDMDSPDPKVSDPAWERFTRAQATASKWPLWIDDRARMNLKHIGAIGLRYVREHGIRFVCIDYAQLMDTKGGKTFSREQEVAGISRGAKLLARTLNVPVVLAAQINRGPELRDDHRPRLSDLRESGGLENDADTVMLLWRPELYLDGKDEKAARELAGMMEVVIAKQRGGRVGASRVIFKGESFRIEDGQWTA